MPDSEVNLAYRMSQAEKTIDVLRQRTHDEDNRLTALEGSHTLELQQIAWRVADVEKQLVALTGQLNRIGDNVKQQINEAIQGNKLRGRSTLLIDALKFGLGIAGVVVAAWILVHLGLTTQVHP